MQLVDMSEEGHEIVILPGTCISGMLCRVAFSGPGDEANMKCGSMMECGYTVNIILLGLVNSPFTSRCERSVYRRYMKI